MFIILLLLIMWSYPPVTHTLPTNMFDRSSVYRKINYGRFETVHAIAIDGGGSKVMLSTGILIKELEEILRTCPMDPIELVTIFSGTSSGSVLSTILANRESVLPVLINMNKDLALTILRSITPIHTPLVQVRRFVAVLNYNEIQVVHIIHVHPITYRCD